MTKNNWPNVDQAPFSNSRRRIRRLTQRLAQLSKQFILATLTVSQTGVENAGILRESLAQPLITIGAPRHDSSPPLMGCFVSDELIGAFVGTVRRRNHEQRGEPLTKVERVKCTRETWIRIVAKQRGEVTY